MADIKNVLPDGFMVVRSIAHVTFREVVRDRVLYNGIVCAVLLFGVAYLASKVTSLSQERLLVDFGISAVDISSSLIAILIGAPIIGRELERRTAYVLLSKPISRFQFLIGKFFGVAAVLAVNWILLVGMFFLIFFLLGGEITGTTLMLGLILVLFKSWLLLALVFFLSTFATTSLSVIMVIGFYLLGVNVSNLEFVAARTESLVATFLFDLVSYIIPDLERFSLGLQVTYSLPVSPNYILGCVLYTLVYGSALILAAGVLIHRKEL